MTSTPKEKAKELVDKFYKGRNECMQYLVRDKEDAKVCALICVDKIINSRPSYPYPYELGIEVKGVIAQIEYPMKYWQEVKQEIENYGMD